MSQAGCTRPAGGPVDPPTQNSPQMSPIKEENISMIKVGKPAPDFKVPGYQKGEFINTKLSDHLGKWVLLCFYPGDFTFV